MAASAEPAVPSQHISQCTIPSCMTRYEDEVGKRRKYTAFMVEVRTHGGLTWATERRYRQFHNLNKVSARMAAGKAVALPGLQARAKAPRARASQGHLRHPGRRAGGTCLASRRLRRWAEVGACPALSGIWVLAAQHASVPPARRLGPVQPAPGQSWPL